MECKRLRLLGNIMGNGLTVKHEVRLTRDDTAILQRIAKARRCTLASLIREGVMEWLARRSYLQEEEKEALGVTAWPSCSSVGQHLDGSVDDLSVSTLDQCLNQKVALICNHFRLTKMYTPIIVLAVIGIALLILYRLREEHGEEVADWIHDNWFGLALLFLVALLFIGLFLL